MTSEKILYVHFCRENIFILVPKSRGNGFLKVPLGHHACPLSDFILHNLDYDVYGLYGMLSVQTGFIGKDKHKALEDSVVKPLAEYYNYPYQLISHEEFWAKHKQGF